MKKTKAEIMESLKSILGENTSDEAIALIEDVSDTLDSMNDTTDWKQKYEEKDAEWRKKYTERFFSGAPEGSEEKKKETEDEQDDGDDAEDITIDELFE